MERAEDYYTFDNEPVPVVKPAFGDRNNQQSEPWGEPDLSLLDTRRVEAPAMPIHIFGPWAEWLTEQADTASAPVDYAAMSLLALTGGCIGNTRWGSPWPGWREPPVLFVGAVGLPSSGKSPSIDTVFKPLRDAEWQLGDGFEAIHKEWIRRKVEAEEIETKWRAECKKAVKDGYATPPMPDGAVAPREPKRPRLFCTDPTMEAAAVLAADEPKGVSLVRDELAGWVGGMDKYGGEGSDRSFWLESYGGRAKVVDRVKFAGVPLRIPHLSFSIVGGIQPDRLASMLLGGDDDGMTARLCLVWPEPVALKRPTSKPDPDRLRDAFVALRGLSPAENEDGDSWPKSVPFTEEAAAVLHDFRLRNRGREGGAAGLYLSWLGKLPGVVLRVATILEHLWWADSPRDEPGGPLSVSAEAVLSALLLIETYLIPMGVRVYGEAALPEVERDAAALARWIMAQGVLPETVNARGLRHARAISTTEARRYDAALAELEEVGWVRPAPSRAGDQPGRKAKTWMVSPKLAEYGRSVSMPRSVSTVSSDRSGGTRLTGANGAIGTEDPNGAGPFGGAIQAVRPPINDISQALRG